MPLNLKIDIKARTKRGVIKKLKKILKKVKHPRFEAVYTYSKHYISEGKIENFKER
jgi:hypothetical protein